MPIFLQFVAALVMGFAAYGSLKVALGLEQRHNGKHWKTLVLRGSILAVVCGAAFVVAALSKIIPF